MKINKYLISKLHGKKYGGVGEGAVTRRRWGTIFNMVAGAGGSSDR